MARPREFDETEVLDAALQCFWGSGYKATSIRDLAEAMQISTPSIYNAFGDKRQLFIDALEHYCRTRKHPLIVRIEDQHTGVDAGGAALPLCSKHSISSIRGDNDMEQFRKPPSPRIAPLPIDHNPELNDHFTQAPKNLGFVPNSWLIMVESRKGAVAAGVGSSC